MAFDWLKIKTDYFTHKTESLGDIARKYGVDEGHLHNIAAKEHWVEERDTIWTKAENKLIESLPETIAQIKLRHAKIARAMQGKAIELLKSGKIESKSTYSDLKTAVDMERDALGMNDKKQQDEVYEKFSQFNFIFSLNKDELRRFIKSALSGGANTGSSNSPILPATTGSEISGK